MVSSQKHYSRLGYDSYVTKPNTTLENLLTDESLWVENESIVDEAFRG